MGEVQLQDIVRQSLQHVGISLAEARKRPRQRDRGRGLRGRRRRADPGLIEEVAAKLEASAGSFAADIGSGELDRGREREKAPRPTSSRNRRSARWTRKASRTARSAISSSSATWRRDGLAPDRQRRGTRSAVSRASRPSFRASRTSSSPRASRSPRPRPLAGVATTVGGMIELTERIEADVGAAMGTTKDFTRLAMRRHRRLFGRSRVRRRRGRRGRAARIDSPGDRAGHSSPIGRPALAARRYRGILVVYRGIHRPHSSRRRRADAAPSPRRGPQVGGLEPPRAQGLTPVRPQSSAGAGAIAVPAVDSERLRRMVERFTIFTHKKVAGSIGRFAVEEGGQAGEVTIF